MEFVYVQVNETQEYVQDSLNTNMVVVLQVLFPYEIIYEMGPPMSEKQVKESQSRALAPSLCLGGGRGVTVWVGEMQLNRRTSGVMGMILAVRVKAGGYG